MSLSNSATPIYYGKFRDAVIRGEIPVLSRDFHADEPNRQYDPRSRIVLR